MAAPCTSFAEKLIETFNIATPGPDTRARLLSGGNQQKAIVARELSRPIKLLIAAQPTRGVDVGSIEYIHSQLLEKRDEGVAVLLISVELGRDHGPVGPDCRDVRGDGRWAS